MTKDPELKPCPFCGSKAEMCGGEYVYDMGKEWKRDYYVRCKKMCCCIKKYKIERKASNHWNRYVSDKVK